VNSVRARSCATPNGTKWKKEFPNVVSRVIECCAEVESLIQQPQIFRQTINAFKPGKAMLSGGWDVAQVPSHLAE